MFFCCLLLFFYLALGLIIRALSCSNLYDVKGILFMKRNIFLHENKFFFSWKEFEDNALYNPHLYALHILDVLFISLKHHLYTSIYFSFSFPKAIKRSNHNYELWPLRVELWPLPLSIMSNHNHDVVMRSCPNNCESWLMK